MKTLIVLLPLLAIALAAPQRGGPDAEAQIVKNSFDNIGVDGYNFAYETSNGISRQEEGKLANAGSENEAIQIHGSYSYTGADGKTVTVNFVADENGFRPQTSIS